MSSSFWANSVSRTSRSPFASTEWARGTSTGTFQEVANLMARGAGSQSRPQY